MGKILRPKKEAPPPSAVEESAGADPPMQAVPVPEFLKLLTAALE